MKSEVFWAIEPMTVGDKIWATAIAEVGVLNLWSDPQRYLTELGLHVIAAINALIVPPAPILDDDSEPMHPSEP